MGAGRRRRPSAAARSTQLTFSCRSFTSSSTSTPPSAACSARTTRRRWARTACGRGGQQRREREESSSAACAGAGAAAPAAALAMQGARVWVPNGRCWRQLAAAGPRKRAGGRQRGGQPQCAKPRSLGAARRAIWAIWAAPHLLLRRQGHAREGAAGGAAAAAGQRHAGSGGDGLHRGGLLQAGFDEGMGMDRGRRRGGPHFSPRDSCALPDRPVTRPMTQFAGAAALCEAPQALRRCGRGLGRGTTPFAADGRAAEPRLPLLSLARARHLALAGTLHHHEQGTRAAEQMRRGQAGVDAAEQRRGAGMCMGARRCSGVNRRARGEQARGKCAAELDG